MNKTELLKKLENIPDDVFEKIAEQIAPLIMPGPEQHVINAFKEWRCNINLTEKYHGVKS